MTAAQAIFKFAQMEGVIPLSGTSDETHMREDVAVEHLSFDPKSEELLLAVRKFIAE